MPKVQGRKSSFVKMDDLKVFFLLTCLFLPRIRKKARYQELLDREELYLQMQEEEDIQDQQKQSVLDFFSLRQSMLLDQMKRETHDQQTGEATAPQQSKTDKTMELGLSPEEAIRMKLSELVDPARSFEFDSLLPGGATADSDDAICKMFEWDEVFMDSVQYTFGSNAVNVLKSVTYEIDGGCNGIAINKGGNAFCRVELFANVPAPTESAASDDVATKRTMLLSGLCSFQFGLESNCLTSMKWTTLEDRCCVSNVRVSGKQIDIGSRGHPCLEYLGSQLIHPSVVSLDHAKQNDGDEINEPGMSI